MSYINYYQFFSFLEIDACTHSSFLSALYFLKVLIEALCILTPIILVVMMMVDLLKKMFDDNKFDFKSITNRLILSVVIYLIPIIVSTIMNLIGNTTYQDCWEGATIDNIKFYKQLEEEEKKAQLENSGIIEPSNSTGNVVILYGGHTLCEYSNENAWPESKSNPGCKSVKPYYCEGGIARGLASKIRNELNSIGFRAYVANEIVASNPNAQKNAKGIVNDSIYGSSINKDYLKKYVDENFGGYQNVELVMEIHFNAGGGYSYKNGDYTSSGHGTEMLVSHSLKRNRPTEVEIAIYNALGQYFYKRHSDQKGIAIFRGTQNLGNEMYFRNDMKVKRFAYPEVAFYDNCTEMKKFFDNENAIAKSMADAIAGAIR